MQQDPSVTFDLPPLPPDTTPPNLDGTPHTPVHQPPAQHYQPPTAVPYTPQPHMAGQYAPPAPYQAPADPGAPAQVYRPYVDPSPGCG